MRSMLLRVLPIRSALILLAPAATLCACATPIAITQAALPCGEMVKASGLLSPTAGASLPQDDSAGEWIAFGDRQTGQLDKANADKAGAMAILDACAAWQAKAAAAGRSRRFLGLF